MKLSFELYISFMKVGSEDGMEKNPFNFNFTSYRMPLIRKFANEWNFMKICWVSRQQNQASSLVWLNINIPPNCCRVWWCGAGTAPRSPAGRAGSAGRSPPMCRPPHSPAGWCPACPPASAGPPVPTATTQSAAATASRTRTTACCTAPPAGPTGGSPLSTPAPAGRSQTSSDSHFRPNKKKCLCWSFRAYKWCLGAGVADVLTNIKSCW